MHSLKLFASYIIFVFVKKYIELFCQYFLQGFGALCLQYAAYGALFKFAHVIVREVSAMISNSEAAQAPTEVRKLTC